MAETGADIHWDISGISSMLSEIQEGKENPVDLSVLQKGMIMKYGQERKITEGFGKIFLTNVLNELANKEPDTDDNDAILGAYKKTQDHFRDQYLPTDEPVDISVKQEI